MCKHRIKKDNKRYCKLHNKFLLGGECLMCSDYMRGKL